jgi:hypothetical protein
VACPTLRCMAESEKPPEHSTANRWIRDVADGDVTRFAIWVALLLAVVVASISAIVREAEAHAPARVPGHDLARWGMTRAGAVLLISFLGGLFVFGTKTKWEVALTWPLLGGGVLGIGTFVTLTAMGQTEPGSVACTGPQPCDIAFGFGTVLGSALAAMPIGGLFIGTYGLRRLAAHLHHRRRFG